jgi:hypothetical protein
MAECFGSPIYFADSSVVLQWTTTEDKKQRTANSTLPKAGLKWWQKLFGSE